MKQLNYKSAGVNIKKADRFVERIKPIVNKTRIYADKKRGFTRIKNASLCNIGSFGGFFRFDVKKYREPILVSSTDGVGTKLKIAFLAKKHDTVGMDLVGMNVNDVLCSGARPLFFLDYIATGKIETGVLTDVVKGIADGCRQAGCALIGGETAEMPAFYKKGEYDLAGFCVGVVKKDKIIDGSSTRIGDVIIGIESSGLHSNGYSLVRKVFSETELKRLSRELLRPTRIYVKPILSLLNNSKNSTNAMNSMNSIKGIAHITGGAFYGKIPRIIPKDKSFIIHKDAWPVPAIFKLIQKKGNIAEKEMYSCFNMGIGMVLTVDKAIADTAVKTLARFKFRSWVIGEVEKGKGELEICRY